MADLELVCFDDSNDTLSAPQPGDRYVAIGPVHFFDVVTLQSTLDGRFIAVDGAKLDLITVTVPIDLDALTIAVGGLTASVVLKGVWDASTVIFPTAALAGESWIVTVGGDVDGVEFTEGDRILAIVDTPSTVQYVDNWLKLDYTDRVSRVNGYVGDVTLAIEDIAGFENSLTTTSIDSLAKLNALVLDATLGDQADFATAAQGVLASTSVQPDDLQNLSSIKFDLAAAISVIEGQMAWNADEGTMDVGMSGGVVLQAGQETHWPVRNDTGITIPEGKAVMASGTLGASGRMTVALFDGSNIANAKYFLGITTEPIANGADGKVTSLGKVRNFKTDYATWVDGQVLWTDNTIPGDLTNVEPTSGCRLPIAFIIYAHSNGTIAVRATDGTYLAEAHDTQISSPALNELLQYNGTAWVNALIAYLQPGDAAHDGFSDTDPNQHIDHTAVTIGISPGLQGGGTIDGNINIALNVNGLSASSVFEPTDELLMYGYGLSGHYRLTRTVLESKLDLTNMVGYTTNWDTAYSWGDHAGLYSLLGHTHIEPVADTLTAFAGGGQVSAVQLAIGLNVLRTVVSDGDSAKLPTAVAGIKVTVANKGATFADLFPSLDDSIDVEAVNTAVPIPPNGVITLQAIDAINWIVL